MQAARLHEYEKPLAIDEVPRPTPGAGQVVIRFEVWQPASWRREGFCFRRLLPRS